MTSKPGVYEITEEMAGSRFAFIIIRAQVNMQDPADIERVGDIQDEITIRQKNRGQFVQTKDWDRAQMLEMRTKYQKKTLKVLAVKKYLARKARSILR